MEHDTELKKAIEFKTNNPMFDGDSNNDSSGDEEAIRTDSEVPFFPEVPVKGAKVKKFVEFDGWYEGKVLSYIQPADTVNVQLSNGTEEQLTLEQYKSHSQAARIPIGDISY